MRKYTILLVFLASLLVPAAVMAKTDRTMPFVTEPLQIYGPQSETTFTYSIDGQAEAGRIYLTTSHSSLLIAPSSLTVSIDDIIVRTINLSEENSKPEELVVQLTPEGLKKGDHTVTLKFNGTIKEGVCTDQHTTGNWLTVHMQSYLKLKGYDREYSMDLQKFTNDFTAFKGEQTSIIIPENADNATHSAAIRLQAHLAQYGSDTSNIEITAKPENRDKWIITGNPEQFTNDEVQKLLSDVTLEQNGMTAGKIDPSTAYILASDTNEIEKLLPVLFRPDWAKQVAGQHLHITDLPKTQPNAVRTFDQLNIAPITIDSEAPSTVAYFATLPYALPLKGKTIFHFELQKSSLLENQLEGKNNYANELILQVNGKMHPVSLQKLTDQETNYTIDIPVANELLMEDSTFTFQIIGNGFQRLDPCTTTDQRQWLQIDTKKSAIQFANPGTDQAGGTFEQLPFPFAFEQSVIVVPSFDDVSDEMYAAIINRFRLNDHLTRIVQKDELDEKMREAEHLILLNTNLQSLGADQASPAELIEAAGFIPGTEQIITTVGKNPWNKDKVVLTMEQQDGALHTTDFIDQLFTAKSSGTIGVYTSSGYLSFNNNKNIEGAAETPAGTVNQTMLFAFIGLLIVIAAITVYVVRRKKKQV